LKRIKVADLFCGCGGTSTGVSQFAEATGRKLELVAVNHWERAVETHAANHPKANHFCQDLTRLKPGEAVPGGKLDLLVASPECFPAGTLILCRQGLVPIEKVKVGDEVLTHESNWKRVTSVMQSVKDTITVRGQGHFGLETTAEHPFYSYPIKPDPRATHLMRPFAWTAAKDLGGQYWITPNVSRAEQISIPPVGGRGFEFGPSFWWFVGRWLADGCARLRDGNSEITLAIGPDKADAVELALAPITTPAKQPRADMRTLNWRRRPVRTAVLFEAGHDGLARWLVEHFGKLAEGKTIPTWLLTADRAIRGQVLAGYVSGDGWHDERKIETQTVSKRLAIGIRLLAESLGHRVQVHFCEPKAYVIEGRTVNGRGAYKLVWVADPIRCQGYTDPQKTVSMTRVKEVAKSRSGVQVFNLSVEDDESYVADGIIVHNCTHHSNARGGKPKNDQSRASAWVVLEWVNALQVDRVLIENVPEFVSWGPLGVDGKPLAKKRGETFKAFTNALKASGYQVEYRVLNAADYGAATSRRRLFIQAVKGRRKIIWPTPTHAKDQRANLFGNLPRWRAAREIIDWTLLGESIFTRKRPLSPNTMKRIEAGLRKFGGPNAEPFIVAMNYLKERGNDGRAVHGLDEPLPTITSQGNRFAFIIPTNYGERNGQTPRYHSAESPLPTVVAGGQTHALVEGCMVQLTHGGRELDIGEPLPTITTAKRGEIGVVQPFLADMRGTGSDQIPATARSLNEPHPTVTAGGLHTALVEPFLTSFNGKPEEDRRKHVLDNPLPTQHCSNRFGLVEPFITPYYGTSGPQEVSEPLATVTTKDRFGLVEPDHVALDIRFRMLQPHELKAAMGFPRDYKITGNRGEQVKQIGNAVEVNQARALAGAALGGAA
jgi:site-specific DNA-cytosine methylase